MNASSTQNTRFAAYLQGQFIPCWAGEVEQTAYGIADSCTVTTFLGEADTDYGRISQSGKYLPLTIKIGTIGDVGINTQLLAAYLEEIDTDYDNDSIDIHGRGVLAPLIDKRLTAKLNQNEDVTKVISQILGSFPGLQYDVNGGVSVGVSAGKILTRDYVSTARNIRCNDYINMLANSVGWRTRVVGAKVIVGPPANDKAPVLTKVWGGPTGGLKLSIKHNALHAHNIHVRCVGVLMRPKQSVKSVAGPSSVTATQDITGQTMVFPTGKTPAKAKAKSFVKYGNIAGVASGGVPQVSEQEEYVFAVKGKNQQELDNIAIQIQADISRHEFIAELEWAPTPAEIKFLCANGVEWLLQLTGCSQQSHNQTYHPKRINWTYSMDGGLTIKVLAVNHLLPQGAISE